MPGKAVSSALMKPLVVLALPGMYLVYKINEFKRHQQEMNRRKVTERELANLNSKIVSIYAPVSPTQSNIILLLLNLRRQLFLFI